MLLFEVQGVSTVLASLARESEVEPNLTFHLLPWLFSVTKNLFFQTDQSALEFLFMFWFLNWEFGGIFFAIDIIVVVGKFARPPCIGGVYPFNDDDDVFGHHDNALDKLQIVALVHSFNSPELSWWFCRQLNNFPRMMRCEKKKKL